MFVRGRHARPGPARCSAPTSTVPADRAVRPRTRPRPGRNARSPPRTRALRQRARGRRRATAQGAFTGQLTTLRAGYLVLSRERVRRPVHPRDVAVCVADELEQLTALAAEDGPEPIALDALEPRPWDPLGSARQTAFEPVLVPAEHEL